MTNIIRRWFGLPELATCGIDRCKIGDCNRKAKRIWLEMTPVCESHYSRLERDFYMKQKARAYMENLK